MKIQSLLSSKLSKKQINEIIYLKNTHWKYSKKSRENWFKDNIKKTDLHNLYLVDKSLVGYTLLRDRTFYDASKKKNKKYYNFDTLILKKNFRNYPHLAKLMRYNNLVIKKKKRFSFLICESDKVNMYKYFGWKLLKKNEYELNDKKTKLIGMIYNYKKLISKKNKIKISLGK